MTSKPEIPGTYVFGIEDCRQGFSLNALCASLATAQNRTRFMADEAAYCDEFDLSADQRTALLARDWKAMLDAGGSIFYVHKLAVVDGRSMQYLGGVFTHMTTEDFIAALKAGGRRFG
jgi:protocatechuate 4,5-dioxygenase alpha chain